MGKIMYKDHEYSAIDGKAEVYKAAWTATSSSGFAAVTETLTLPAGIYIGIIKIPVCSQKTSLAFGLVPTPSDFSTGGMLAVDQGTLTFQFTLDTPTPVYVNSQMSTATTYTYIERGYFKAIRLCSIDGESNDIVETGTSGIWTYRKWSDGTAECWGEIPSTAYAITGTWTNGRYASSGIDWPSGLFINTPVASLNKNSSGAGLIWISISSNTSSHVNFYVCDTAGQSSVSLSIAIQAKGKWK